MENRNVDGNCGGGREVMDIQNEKYNLFAYIEQQLEDLDPQFLFQKVFLDKIEDDGINLTFNFLSGNPNPFQCSQNNYQIHDEPVNKTRYKWLKTMKYQGYSVTIPDQLISRFWQGNECKIITNRKKFIQELELNINECLAFLKTNQFELSQVVRFRRKIEGDVDFSMPICPEVELIIRCWAFSAVHIDKIVTYEDLLFMLESYSPVCVYNYVKYLVLLANSYNPPHRSPLDRYAIGKLEDILKNPQYYLNPYRIVQRDPEYDKDKGIIPRFYTRIMGYTPPWPIRTVI